MSADSGSCNYFFNLIKTICLDFLTNKENEIYIRMWILRMAQNFRTQDGAFKKTTCEGICDGKLFAGAKTPSGGVSGLPRGYEKFVGGGD